MSYALHLLTSAHLSGARALDLVLNRVRHRVVTRTTARGDRGDVNGYVFVTLMTAGIVMVIWVVARDRLTTLFERAIASVTGP